MLASDYAAATTALLHYKDTSEAAESATTAGLVREAEALRAEPTSATAQKLYAHTRGGGAGTALTRGTDPDAPRTTLADWTGKSAQRLSALAQRLRTHTPSDYGWSPRTEEIARTRVFDDAEKRHSRAMMSLEDERDAARSTLVVSDDTTGVRASPKMLRDEREQPATPHSGTRPATDDPLGAALGA